ncbi:MAG: bifunctional adenosylcobinamide kinase/adenosylcobinamide-phosphate guanylyltransferase [Dehalococcoidia bacterium]|nr:bifunctional adenosylcobinamide kinase/adenosylcobinamide-phosphate guanylyltransferase [Dehalococcoidia bacterium]
MAKQITLILGGARSGKSHYAQQLAAKLSDKVLFVATGEALDEEMQARIAEHKKSRPKNWQTLEIPTGIGRRIERQIGDAEVVLIDCLTLLISNLLRDEPDYPEAEKRVTSEINELIAAMDKLDASFVIVSNEVGMGLVPETKLGRIYRDLLGKANQLLASHATEVYLMVACLPVRVKGQL